MNERALAVLYFFSRPVIGLGTALIIAAGLLGGTYFSTEDSLSGTYVKATLSSIASPGEGTSNLSFQVSGKIVSIPVSLGQEVSAGQVLVALDRSFLNASLAGAKANLELAKAKLAALTAGTRPEQIGVDQTSEAQDSVLLDNAIQSAYVAADNAIHVTADTLFTNPRLPSARLTFTTFDYELTARVIAERVALEPVLGNLASDTPSAAEAGLAQVSGFLTDLTELVSESTDTAPASAASTLAAARSSVSAAAGALSAADTTLKSAEGTLTLAKAPATPEDVAAAQAAVDAAQASVDATEVSLSQTILAAPSAGTVTALNAHLGETVTPGETIAAVDFSGSTEDALVVPSSAVIEDGASAFVYVRSASGPVKTPVVTGLTSDAGFTQITSGLMQGDEVLAFGM